MIIVIGYDNDYINDDNDAIDVDDDSNNHYNYYDNLVVKVLIVL